MYVSILTIPGNEELVQPLKDQCRDRNIVISHLDVGVKKELLEGRLEVTRAHLRNIQTAFDKNFSVCFIMEDDCRFDKRFDEHFLKTVVSILENPRKK
jgi:hypothetical protein